MSGTCTTGTATGGGTGGSTTGGGNGTTGGGNGSTGGGNGSTGGETCEAAALITPGTVMGDTTGHAPNYDPGCSGPTPGPDVAYRISVPAGQRLSATATPDLAAMGGNQYDLSLYLIEAPASNCNGVVDPDAGVKVCAGASDHPTPPESPETVSYLNNGTAAVDVFLIVDSYYGAAEPNPDGGVGVVPEGKFTLTTSIAPPAQGDTCETAIALTPGTQQMADLATYGPDYSGAGACAGTAGTNDMAYKVTVAPGQLLNLTVTPDPTFDPTISVSESAAECDVTCVQTVDVGFEGDPETLSYKNTTAAPKTLFIVIDGYGVGGPITVDSSLVTPPLDDTCAQPLALSTVSPMTAQTITNYSNDYDSFASTCGFETGPDRVYGVTVPDGKRLTVVVTPQTSADPSLSLVDGAANCNMTCLAHAFAAGSGGVETMQFTNRSGAQKDYLVVVDFATGSTGTFDISATIDTPPADDVCLGPTTLTAGATAIAGTTVGYTNDYDNGSGATGCATTGALGPDRVYQIAVPASQRATVTVTPTVADGGFNPSINFVETPAANCSVTPRVCAGGSNLGATNAPEVARITNATGAAKTYFAIVDSTTPPGAFTIGYTTATPPADDTCGTTTTVLTAGTRATESLAAFAPDYTSGTGCRSSNGPDRGYKVTLAANEKIGVTVNPTGGDAGIDAVVNFVVGPAANCEASPRVCRGGTNSVGTGLAESSAYTNNSGASQEVFLLVADFSTTTAAPGYSLTTTIGASPAGESCQNPAPLAAGMTTGQSTTGASNDVVYNTASSATCTSITRPDRVYAITLPASKVLTVVATPDTTEDLLLNLIDSPATSCNDVQACLQTADVGFSGDPETLTYTNGAAQKTVFLQVSAYSNDAKYSLNVTIQ